MKVQRNGSQVAQADLDTTDPFEVILSGVDCFEYFYCGSASLWIKLGKMRSTVTGGSGNYTYSWIVDCKTGPVTTYGNVDRVPLATCCATYFLTVVDNETGCVIKASRRYCGAIVVDIPIKDEIAVDSLIPGGGVGGGKGFGAQEEGVGIFPNPVQDVLVLSLDLNLEESRVVQVINNQGKVLYNNCLLYTSPSPRD